MNNLNGKNCVTFLPLLHLNEYLSEIQHMIYDRVHKWKIAE